MGFYLNKLKLFDYRKMHSNTDWDTVTYLRKTHHAPGAAKNKQNVNAAMRRGGDEVETRQKFAAGTNKKLATSKNTMKLDQETDQLHHDTVSLSVGRLIQKGRQDKQMNQKELATKINEKAQVINEYESGKAIPNNQVLGKIERAIGIKLRGKDKGKPLQPPGKKVNARLLLSLILSFQER